MKIVRYLLDYIEYIIGISIFDIIFETLYAIPNQILSQIPVAFQKRTCGAFAVCIQLDYQMLL